MGVVLLCHLYDLCLILGPVYTCCVATKRNIPPGNELSGNLKINK